MEWQQLRQKMRDYRRIMAKRHEGFEGAWTVERGSRNGMLHVNMLQKGPYVPQAELQKTWGGIVHVQRIKRADGAAGYAMKEALRVAGYSVKDASGARLQEHLTLNGGRLAHLSRGYLGGQTVDAVRRRLLQADGADGSAWHRRDNRSTDWAAAIAAPLIPGRPRA